MFLNVVIWLSYRVRHVLDTYRPKTRPFNPFYRHSNRRAGDTYILGQSGNKATTVYPSFSSSYTVIACQHKKLRQYFSISRSSGFLNVSVYRAIVRAGAAWLEMVLLIFMVSFTPSESGSGIASSKNQLDL